ncbi:MAG: hypothetical protein P1P90_00740 [Patescibacteria group bacterium]|nr:hypothetical protein [Patescibacteria group bacterium]
MHAPLSADRAESPKSVIGGSPGLAVALCPLVRLRLHAYNSHHTDKARISFSHPVTLRGRFSFSLIFPLKQGNLSQAESLSSQKSI